MKKQDGRPKGVGKYEKAEKRKWPVVKRNNSSVGAWCYVCAEEHRWADCKRRTA